MTTDLQRHEQQLPDTAAAIDELERRHTRAATALRGALDRFVRSGEPPDAAMRARFRYPELRVTCLPGGDPAPPTWRAWAKLQGPGIYATTITQPGYFRRYLTEQLEPLVAEYGATITVGDSTQELPYAYVLEAADELVHGEVATADLVRHFPTPNLSSVGDEVADGTWALEGGRPLPLALFDAVRVDYSLHRLVHYTGTDWRAVQPWILLTNYQRYVDQFVRWAMAELADPASPYDSLSAPGGAVLRRDTPPEPGRGADRGGAVARLPDAGLPPGALGRARRRHHRQYRRGAVQRQEHHRPPGGAAAALLADGGALRAGCGTRR